MAPSNRALILLFVLILVFHLTESKTQKLTRSRRSPTRRGTTRRTTGFSNTGYPTRGGLFWWHIVLIILGIILLFALLYCCVRQCSNREPESDTPGINTTRDQIQLRDHKTVNHFSNHYSTPQPGYTPQEGGMYNRPPTDAMYPPAPAANSSYPPSCDGMYPPSSSPAPPSYGNVIGYHKEMIDDGAIDAQLQDKWEDDVNFKRKDFGVI